MKNSRLSFLRSCVLAIAVLGGGGTAFATTYPVTNYGALCDGVTDDGVAIQNAVEAASAAGGRVLFPAGVCVTGSTISVANTSGVYLEGAGRGVSVLKRAPGSYSGWAYLVSVSSTTDSGIRDMTLDGNRNLTTGGVQVGLHLSWTLGIVVSGIELLDHSTNAARIYGSSGLTISGSRFVNTTGEAIYIDRYCSDLLVDGNDFESSVGQGIYHYAGGATTWMSRLTVTRNNFRQSGEAPAIFISWGGVVDSVISGNLIEGGDIVTYSLGRSSISNNVLKDAAISVREGISLPLVVANNSIESSRGYSISLQGVSGGPEDSIQMTVSGNRIKSNHGGIRMSQGHNVSIVGNSITPISTPFSDYGHGVIASGLKPIQNLLIANNEIVEMIEAVHVGPYSTYPHDVDTVLITGNIIHSNAPGASGVSVVAGPNRQGAMTTNYLVEGNLEVLIP